LITFIQKILERFIGKDETADYFSDYVVKNSVRLLLLQCVSLGLGFVANYVLIKFAGVNDYGSYVYIFNFLYLLVNFCILGMDTLLVKHISLYDEAHKYSELKGVVFLSLGISVVASIVIAVIATAFVDVAGILKNTASINWFVLSVSTLAMISLSTLIQACLQGLKKITLSQVVEKIIRPLIIILFALALFVAGKKIGLEELIWINLSALGISLLINYLLFQKNLGLKLGTERATYSVGDWTRASLSFFLLGALYMVNSRIDVFLLGLFRANDEVGVYNIVLKVSEMVAFGLIIINFIIAPVIGRLLEHGDLSRLQRLVTQSARMVLLIGLPLMLLIILFRKNILLFFGVNLFNGQEALVILCCGQLVNILCGSVGTLLLMSGYQRFSIYSLAAGTIFNIIFNLILTPKYGIVGTAIATAGSVAIWNCLMYFFVRIKINIRPTAFGIA